MADLIHCPKCGAVDDIDLTEIWRVAYTWTQIEEYGAVDDTCVDSPLGRVDSTVSALCNTCKYAWEFEGSVQVAGGVR